MKKPIILITPSKNGNMFSLRSHYTSAVQELGGVAVVLPYTKDQDSIKAYCDMADGVIFSGGVDIDPKYFGEEKLNDSVDICRERDEAELALFEAFYKTGKPILGICRGMQLINVALGGTLFQDIPDHKQELNRWDTPYTAKIEKDSFLYTVINEEKIKINSFHHQAVKKVAPTLRPVAFDVKDGTVEAIETTENRFLVAVQWHPEDFYRENTAAQRLFKTFTEEAGRCKQEK